MDTFRFYQNKFQNVKWEHWCSFNLDSNYYTSWELHFTIANFVVVENLEMFQIIYIKVNDVSHTKKKKLCNIEFEK